MLPRHMVRHACHADHARIRFSGGGGMSTARLLHSWQVEVEIDMPTYVLVVEADSYGEACDRAIREMNESGDIPEHGEYSASAQRLSP